MALTYNEDLTAMFVQGFSEPVITKFVDGYYNGATDQGSTFINMSTFTPGQSQPTDAYWMSFQVTESFTFNDSILDGASKTKRLVVFVDFSIFWPEELSKKYLNTTIEPLLDSIFLNAAFRGSDGSEVYSQQDQPKDVTSVVRATGSNKWNRKDITYSFVVRYI
tara:strand:+ start:4424 stop:4915 length:492 start_codon:yes stop_codon:yes gene_type:complete